MENYIHIATFTYPSELTIAKLALEASKIDCYVRDELTIQVHNFASNAIGGIRLEVPEKQYEEALKILVDSGFENFLMENSTDPNEQNKTPNKLLKISIGIVTVISLILISIVTIRLLFNG